MHTDATWCGQYVRAKHNLAFEPVTVMGSTEKCFREAETNSFSAALEDKETLRIPKSLISSRRSASTSSTVLSGGCSLLLPMAMQDSEGCFTIKSASAVTFAQLLFCHSRGCRGARGGPAVRSDMKQ